ncbi:unnamed protein product, partial [Musa acuminata var. zebrina]
MQLLLAKYQLLHHIEIHTTRSDSYESRNLQSTTPTSLSSLTVTTHNTNRREANRTEQNRVPLHETIACTAQQQHCTRSRASNSFLQSLLPPYVTQHPNPRSLPPPSAPRHVVFVDAPGYQRRFPTNVLVHRPAPLRHPPPLRSVVGGQHRRSCLRRLPPLIRLHPQPLHLRLQRRLRPLRCFQLLRQLVRFGSAFFQLFLHRAQPRRQLRFLGPRRARDLLGLFLGVRLEDHVLFQENLHFFLLFQELSLEVVYLCALGKHHHWLPLVILFLCSYGLVVLTIACFLDHCLRLHLFSLRRIRYFLLVTGGFVLSVDGLRRQHYFKDIHRRWRSDALFFGFVLPLPITLTSRILREERLHFFVFRGRCGGWNPILGLRQSLLRFELGGFRGCQLMFQLLELLLGSAQLGLQVGHS